MGARRGFSNWMAKYRKHLAVGSRDLTWHSTITIRPQLIIGAKKVGNDDPFLNCPSYFIFRSSRQKKPVKLT